MEGKTQETAAAKAGMSVRSAREWQSGPLPSATNPEHQWTDFLTETMGPTIPDAHEYSR